MKGTVKWYSKRRGYGFITGEDEKDVFVHYSGIAGEGFKSLVKGDNVMFDICEGKSGPQAENVMKL